MPTGHPSAEACRPSGQILGPHFEEICREWTKRYALAEALGGPIGPVGSTVISDAQGRTRHEADVVVLAEGEVPGRKEARVALIGEAKWTNRMRDLTDLSRLDHIRGLMVDQGTQAVDALLALAVYSRSGFDARLRKVAGQRADVLLVELSQPYGSS